ncbi:MAG: hypothetical protein J0H09_25210 [Burkholderiales bacterium]|nr:hypothetical protein [Burkholderiales bacterium]
MSSSAPGHAAGASSDVHPAGQRRGVLPTIALIAALGWAAALPPAHAEQRPEPALPAQMPSATDAAGLHEFYVSPTTTNRFAVHLPSLAVDQNRIVRLMLVVTSRNGVRNVSYDAIDCDQHEYQLLAIGRADGGWTPVGQVKWRPVGGQGVMNTQYVALFEKLCVGGRAADADKLRLRLTSPPAPIMQ